MGTARTYSDGNISQNNRVMAAWLNGTNTVVFTLFGNGSEYTGNANLPANLAVAGNVTIAQKLDVTGNTTLGNLTVNGAFSPTGNQSFGNVLVTGQLSVVGNQSVVGEYTQTGNMTVSGAGNLGSLAGAVVATQAQMEAASATNVVATPGRIQNNPGVAKAWITFNGASGGAVLRAHNATFVRNGTGAYTISYNTPLSGANYPIVAAAIEAGTDVRFVNIAPTNAGNCSVQVLNSTFNIADSSYVSVVSFGDQ